MCPLLPSDSDAQHQQLARPEELSAAEERARRIERLRQQIQAGTYRPVPERIADAVLASGDLF